MRAFIKYTKPRLLYCTWLMCALGCSNSAGTAADAIGPIIDAGTVPVTAAAGQADTVVVSGAGSANRPHDSAVATDAPTTATKAPDAAGTSTRADAATPAKDAAVAPRKDAAPSDAAGTAPQKCPASQAPLTAGNQTISLQHGGQARSYILHVPPGVTATKPLAVVFDLHGAYSNASQQQGLSGWDAVAEREGFLTVYPEGTGGFWNVDDTCCGTAGTNKVDDVGFIKAIIKKLSTDTCIDSKRIYATGLSNGGGFTHRLGCDAADAIAAVAPVSTDLRTNPCKPARPISMMEFRGTGDTLEPYEGGVVGPPGGQYTSPGAKGSLKLWTDINQCTGTPKTIDQYCESYTECTGGVETDLCSMPDVGHVPYSNALNFSIVETAWKMFKRQPMK
jgi:polyhydroxybutyrate depolymerase